MKAKWINIYRKISPEEIWEMIPHKRNEYFCGIEWIPSIHHYQIESTKKEYRRKK